jgi:Zn-finger nucleic acid-binding protein
MNFLSCPKCPGQMRQYQRNGITVDQCTECRGIFLDRGELEHLVTAENQWSGGEGPGYQQPYQQGRRDRDGAWDDEGGWDDDDDNRRRYQQYDDDHEGGPHRRRRKKSFLEGLFDG